MEIVKELNDYSCTLIINRPNKMNSLTGGVMFQLAQEVNKQRIKAEKKILIIRGVGEKAFCSGGDLIELSNSGKMEEFIQGLVLFQKSLLSYPFPVFAMAYGAVIGAGLDIASLCDIRLAADNAYFGANLIKIGKVYHYTSVLRLINLVGFGIASELLLTGTFINALRAERIGLVNRVMLASELESKTYNLAKRIIKESSYGALMNTKLMLRVIADVRIDDLKPEVKQKLQNLCIVGND